MAIIRFSSSTSLNNGKHYADIMESADENVPVNGNGNLRRTTSECPINGSNGKSHIDNTTEDEWSRASSEEHSDYGADQSIDDLDKKVRNFESQFRYS